MTPTQRCCSLQGPSFPLIFPSQCSQHPRRPRSSWQSLSSGLWAHLLCTRSAVLHPQGRLERGPHKAQMHAAHSTALCSLSTVSTHWKCAWTFTKLGTLKMQHHKGLSTPLKLSECLVPFDETKEVARGCWSPGLLGRNVHRCRQPMRGGGSVLQGSGTSCTLP